MKKLIISLGCLVFALSCKLEFPQSITIKANPELHLSLGSPFKEGEGLVDYISPKKIKEMMSDSGDSGINIYEYRGPLSDIVPAVAADTLTYLVHYPIAEMQLELDKYIGNAIEQAEEANDSLTIPNLSGGFPQYLDAKTGPKSSDASVINPAFRIPLSDMAMLVDKVVADTGSGKRGFGISITFEKFTNPQNVEVCIPAFNVGSSVGIPRLYSSGTPEGNRTYYCSIADFSPKTSLTDGNIDIYIMIAGQCSGTIIIKFVFDWKEAYISASTDPIEGKYSIDNQDLKDFLGTGVKFKEASGFIYVNGITGTANLALSAILSGGPVSVSLASGELINKNRPDFEGQYINTLPPHSLASQASIPFTEVLNESLSGSRNLEYKITVPSWKIENDTNVLNKVISADLFILLPLEAEITSPSSETGYVKLNFNDAFGSFSSDGSDIFGRSGDGDDIFKYIEEVTVILRNLKSSIIDESKLAVKVTNNTEKVGLLLLGSTKPSLVIDKSIINPVPFEPFNPEFEILLNEDFPGAGYGTFKILRQALGKKAEFDFNLTIAAKVRIDETVEF